MKNQFCFIAITLGLAVTALNSRLMAQDVTATVPFAYEVRSSQMAAGRTIISLTGTQHSLIQITNADTGRSVFAGIMSRTAKESAPKLVFHRYGNRYFLVEAALGSGGLKLRPSQAEKEYALTMQVGKPKLVYLALR